MLAGGEQAKAEQEEVPAMLLVGEAFSRPVHQAQPLQTDRTRIPGIQPRRRRGVRFGLFRKAEGRRSSREAPAGR
jgi:hypothetical protein